MSFCGPTFVNDLVPSVWKVIRSRGKYFARAGLAGRRQRDRGVQPTKWLLKWRTQISLCVAVHIGRCILDALPNDVRNYRHQHLSVPFSGADSWDSGNPYPGSGRLNTLAPA